MSVKTILILGGTAEARALAEQMADRFRVITSLAGVTRHPAVLAGSVRVGGFGGVEGLAGYLKGEHIDHVVDATHPFAATISNHAFRACQQTNTPCLRLNRAPWGQPEGATWIHATSTEDAALKLPGLSQRAFLTVGGNSLGPFAGVENIWFLVRLLEQGAPLNLAHYDIVTGRPPFRLEDERALLETHAIDCVVSKNAGGTASRTKIDAAAAAGIPVIMIARPAEPYSETTPSVDDAVRILCAA